MGADGEEFAQSLRSARDRIWTRDAERIEALRAGRLGERGLDRSRRQKSRLA
jgi:hypothetical protein